jgi:hypothetical protein
MHKLYILLGADFVVQNREADYFEFYKLCSSSVLKLVSEKKRLCHGKYLMHRYRG